MVDSAQWSVHRRFVHAESDREAGASSRRARRPALVRCYRKRNGNSIAPWYRRPVARGVLRRWIAPPRAWRASASEPAAVCLTLAVMLPRC